MGEGERYNDNHDKYVYFSIGREHSISRQSEGGVGGKWGVTVYFISIVSLCCATPGVVTEGWKIMNILNVLLKV